MNNAQGINVKDTPSLEARLRCLAVLLQQLNAQTACAAVNEAIDRLTLAPEASGADYVMVPREPTPEMIAAALAVKPVGQFYPGHTATESEYVNEKHYGGERRANIYRAMLAAAPFNPAPPTSEKCDCKTPAACKAHDCCIATTPADEPGADDAEFFPIPAGLHPHTVNLVARFAAALADKLAKAERKYGYSDGWASPEWMDECRAKLLEHVAKGDPRDVAAYCAFLWHHGESTTAEPRAAGQEGWLIDGNLIYRLSDERRPQNTHEIKVTQWAGSRSMKDCDAAARELFARLQPSGAAEDAARSKYEELIYAVASRFPGETRHETALRYIREREAAANEGGAARLARGEYHD